MNFFIIDQALISSAEKKILKKSLKKFTGPATYEFKRAINADYQFDGHNIIDYINDICSTERNIHRINVDNWVVYLYYDRAANGFSSGADYQTKNIYFNMGAPNILVNDDWKYPLIYELATLPLQLQMFDTFNEFFNYSDSHEHDGCINQICKHIGDNNVKMRTADICYTCGQKIRERNIRDGYIIQTMNIINDVRSNLLLSNSWFLNIPPQRINAWRNHLRFQLPDFGQFDLELHGKQIYPFYYSLLSLNVDPQYPNKPTLTEKNIGNETVWGIDMNKLTPENVNYFSDRYISFLGAANQMEINYARNSITNLFSDNSDYGLLQSVISRTNTLIRNQLGKISNYYEIKNLRGQSFYYLEITAHPDLIHILQ